MSARRRSHTARSPVLDLVRGLIYVLLPIALVATIVFMAQSALETLEGPAHIHDALNGASQVTPAARWRHRKPSSSSAPTAAASSMPTAPTRSRTRPGSPTSHRSGLAHQPAGNMEGKEVRFGDTFSALYATASTQTSTGQS